MHVPPFVLVSAAVILSGRGRKPVGGSGAPLGDPTRAVWWTMFSVADAPPSAAAVEEGGR